MNGGGNGSNTALIAKTIAWIAFALGVILLFGSIYLHLRIESIDNDVVKGIAYLARGGDVDWMFFGAIACGVVFIGGLIIGAKANTAGGNGRKPSSPLPAFLHVALVRLGLLRTGEEKRKTVSFGDPSAARGGYFWSIVSVAVVFALWFIATENQWTSPIFLPPPADVWGQFTTTLFEGFRGYNLLEHVGVSVYRLLMGFVLGCVVGIPIGFAMGLSRTMRGIFDPIVEFMRPIPPLALIPLMIIWAGIDNKPKVILLFLAALWIMVLAARAGVQSIRLSKIHAAYTLGASRVQVLFRVILPNALPEIFTGMRVSMGVCWGTLVAAELVAADIGIGFMIVVGGKFLETGLVLVGIIIIGIIGAAIDVGMRRLEARMIPWKGKG